MIGLDHERIGQRVEVNILESSANLIYTRNITRANTVFDVCLEPYLVAARHLQGLLVEKLEPLDTVVEVSTIHQIREISQLIPVPAMDIDVERFVLRRKR